MMMMHRVGAIVRHAARSAAVRHVSLLRPVPASAVAIAARPLVSIVALAPHRMYADTAIAERLKKLVKSDKLFVFMKGTPDSPMCGYSRAVIQILDLHGIPPEKVSFFNILSDEDVRTGMKELSEWPTFPQIYVDGEFVGGCDILISMHQSGELKDLLKTIGHTSTHQPGEE